MFSANVIEFWHDREATAGSGAAEGTYSIVVDGTLNANRSLTLFHPVDGRAVLTVTPTLADLLDVAGRTAVSADALGGALDAANIQLNGADHLFYLPVDEQAVLIAERTHPQTRQLTDRDAYAFAEFAAHAPADDLDEAFVELDHWLAFGTFAGGQLVSAASVYPWQGTRLVDLGVITLPAFRGRGLGRATVRAISAHALERGFEPQYRCQLDNLPSIALARASGFARFGTWDVIALAGD